MPLRSVPEIRIAQIYRASLTQGQFFSPLRRASESIGGKVTKRQASVAGRLELPSNLDMRADANAGRASSAPTS